MSGRIYDAIWGRTFAHLYDIAFVLAERSGLGEVRKSLLAQAVGLTVELGAGTGLNLPHYGAAVTQLVLTEPDQRMARKLRSKTAKRLNIEVLQAGADALPLADAAADTVVSTLVLCTVPDPAAALAEVFRVLKPGGRFLFAEHVRSDAPRFARWQDRLQRPWGWYACGCQCNRDTVATIRHSPLELYETRADRLRWISPLVRPLVIGTAGR